MKKFQAVRKPIYVCEISASADDFVFTNSIFEQFVARNPEFANCKYDKQFDCRTNTWTLRLYRECAIDFVEEASEIQGASNGIGDPAKTVLRTCRKGE